MFHCCIFGLTHRCSSTKFAPANVILGGCHDPCHFLNMVFIVYTIWMLHKIVIPNKVWVITVLVFADAESCVVSSYWLKDKFYHMWHEHLDSHECNCCKSTMDEFQLGYSVWYQFLECLWLLCIMLHRWFCICILKNTCLSGSRSGWHNLFHGCLYLCLALHLLKWYLFSTG